jgi:hypothetical protein
MRKKNPQKEQQTPPSHDLDAFDQVIIEMAQKGTLDMSAVVIHQDPLPPETEEYSQNRLARWRKHFSE